MYVEWLYLGWLSEAAAGLARLTTKIRLGILLNLDSNFATNVPIRRRGARLAVRTQYRYRPPEDGV